MFVAGRKRVSDGQAAQGMPTQLWNPQAAPPLEGPAQQSPAVGSTAMLGHCSSRLREEREGRLLFYSYPLSFYNIFFFLRFLQYKLIAGRAVENRWEPKKAPS